MTSIAVPRCHRWRLALLVAFVVCAWIGSARAADRAAWDFTLPTLEGDRFVKLSNLSGSVLVNFWGRDCPPCVAELPRLQAFAAANRGWTILLVCTDEPQKARVFLQKHHITLTALKPGANVVGLMHRAGNRDGGLPFTVVLRNASVRATHEGGLSEADLEALSSEKT